MPIDRSVIGGFLAVLLLCFALPARAQNVLVTYFSRTGHTKAMAEAVAKGARSVPGAHVRLLTIDATAAEDLLWADAIILGSPVYNANAAPPVLESLLKWPFKRLKNRVGAVFVTGGWISGGQELTEMHLVASMLEFGLIVVGGEGSAPFGAAAITEEPPFARKGDGAVDPQFLAHGEALGHRVAEVALWLESGRPQPAEPMPAPTVLPPVATPSKSSH
jgi:NAD(P)H dehydrogenase (quinone)